MQNIDSYKEFQGKILPFIKIKLNSLLSVHDVYAVELLSRLSVISHLYEHKVRRDFKNGTNSM